MDSEEVIEKLADDSVLKEINEQLCLKVQNSICRLYSIWDEFGIDNAQKIKRGETVCMHVENLLQEMVEEETGFYEDIKERIQNYKGEIVELSKLLNVPVTEDIEGSLIKKEENLREEFDNLSKLKDERLKTFEDLRAVEAKYCKRLGVSSLNLPSDIIIPSEESLRELDQHIIMLKLEKNKRLKKLCVMKKELTTILETTELEPETALEKDIISGNEDNMSLSNDTLKAMDEAIYKVKSKKAELESLQKILLDKLVVLWQRLGISDDEKKCFLSKHADVRVSTIKSIKNELEKCEEIKKQNMQNYIESIRKELKNLWDKCFVSETRRKFCPYDMTEYNEHILEVHDNEAEKWRNYYKRTEHIINKIVKRQQLWDLMITLENKASDPNRYKNRRGNLLQEERERKKVQKSLPILENEIINDINSYEVLTGEPFLYFGEDFRFFVDKQWKDRLNQKENEKVMRQKMHIEQLDDKITSTPISKKLLFGTPRSAPSRLFKPNLGVPIYRSPTAGSPKTTANTVGKLKVKKTRCSSTKKIPNNVDNRENILREENQNHGVVSSDETTYGNFAAELNKSSRRSHRSTVLSSRKVTGTRISRKINKHNKRKSKEVLENSS